MYLLRLLAPLAALLLVAAASRDDILSAQRTLAAQGLYSGALDGKWGKQTSASVQLFQRRRGLKPTGQLDEPTLLALKEATAKPPLPVKATAQERVRRAASTPLAAPAPTAPSADAIPASEVKNFVERYVNATEQARLDEELAYFAEQVDYLDLGRVALRTIKRDQTRYFYEWPVRQYELAAPPEIIRADAASATVRYRMAFKIGSANRSDAGVAETILELKKIPGGLAITSIHERRLPLTEDVPAR